jgi:hypothetical protein
MGTAARYEIVQLRKMVNVLSNMANINAPFHIDRWQADINIPGGVVID